MESQPRRSSRTLLWGTLFGIVFAILLVVERLFEGRLARFAGLGAPRPGLALLAPAILFVLEFTCFFLAGLLSARRTHALSSGLAAGLIAGIIAGVVGLVIALHTASAAEQVVRHAAVAPRLRSVLQAGIAGAVVRAVFGAITTVLVGAGAGALGGLAGRGSAAGTPGSPGPLPYSTGGTVSVPGYPPVPPQNVSGQQYGPVTPHTYIQGNDSPTVQTLRRE